MIVIDWCKGREFGMRHLWVLHRDIVDISTLQTQGIVTMDNLIFATKRRKANGQNLPTANLSVGANFQFECHTFRNHMGETYNSPNHKLLLRFFRLQHQKRMLKFASCCLIRAVFEKTRDKGKLRQLVFSLRKAIPRWQISKKSCKIISSEQQEMHQAPLLTPWWPTFPSLSKARKATILSSKFRIAPSLHLLLSRLLRWDILAHATLKYPAINFCCSANLLSCWRLLKHSSRRQTTFLYVEGCNQELR